MSREQRGEVGAPLKSGIWRLLLDTPGAKIWREAVVVVDGFDNDGHAISWDVFWIDQLQHNWWEGAALNEAMIKEREGVDITEEYFKDANKWQSIVDKAAVLVGIIYRDRKELVVPKALIEGLMSSRAKSTRELGIKLLPRMQSDRDSLGRPEVNGGSNRSEFSKSVDQPKGKASRLGGGQGV